VIEVVACVAPDGRLSGATAEDQRILQEAEGGPYTCRLTTSNRRSMSQLALYWVVCGLISDNLSTRDVISKETISDVLKVKSGHADIIQFPDGSYRYQPRSIAFNKLGHVAFCELLDKMLTAASQVFGDALTESARKEFHKMVGG
jgi:hypothetical protein